MTLKFGNNQKMKNTAKMLGIPQKHVVNFDLPAGFTCPSADKCQAYAHRVTGKIRRGAKSQFLCFAAKLEAAFTDSRKMHWHNFDVVMSYKDDAQGLANVILSSIPPRVKVIRIHSSGDFFSAWYYEAWLLVAAARPDILFFGYTKQVFTFDYERPENFGLIYSYGGKDDKIAVERGLPMSHVALTECQVVDWGLPLSCADKHHADDFYRVMRGESFILMFH